MHKCSINNIDAIYQHSPHKKFLRKILLNGNNQSLISYCLKKNNIEPYIWMEAKISKAVKTAKQNQQSLGILGIACVPELVFGMRKCRIYGIPVVGVPLNANRCIRWFGEFHQNSVDTDELEKLTHT